MTTTQQSQSLSSLSSSVTSLRHSLSLLDSSISVLDSGISDFPRLKTVLSSTRVCLPSPPPSPSVPLLHPSLCTSLHPSHSQITPRTDSHSNTTADLKQHFELTPSTTLLTAQQSLASELAPAITTLLSRADLYISKLERKQNNLTARSELLEGRLETTRDKAAGNGSVKRQRSLEKLVRKTGLGGGEEKALRYVGLFFSGLVWFWFGFDSALMGGLDCLGSP